LVSQFKVASLGMVACWGSMMPVVVPLNPVSGLGKTGVRSSGDHFWGTSMVHGPAELFQPPPAVVRTDESPSH
jgi:hypothetical protein